MYFRIPLGFFTSLGLVNFPDKIDTRFLFTLENNMKSLFETNSKANVRIKFHDAPYVSYPQITVDDKFSADLNSILRSRGALRTGVISSKKL